MVNYVTKKLGTYADSISSGDNWVNPTDALTYGENVAYCDITKNDVTEYLEIHGCGFQIPPQATINGIEMRMNRKGESTDVYDSKVYIHTGNTDTAGPNYAAGNGWGGTYVVQTFGSPTDKWGRSWTPADINDYYFGVKLECTNDKSSSRYAYVDYMEMVVYWSLPNPMMLHFSPC